MSKTFGTIALAALIVLMGAYLRLHDLGEKPMHGDEANQAVKAGHLLETGEYRYDPFEHHGPTLYYGMLPIFWASGTHSLAESEEWQYRLLPALSGVLLLIVLLGFQPGLGTGGTLWALWFTAISHGMVYYSRYFIQEMLLVLLMAAFLLAVYRYLRSPSWFWAVSVGLAAGLAQATKETAPVLFVCAGAAIAVFVLPYLYQQQIRGGADWWRVHFRRMEIALASLAAVAVFVVLYSSFFKHPQGILDAFRTYLTYVQRAEGHGSTALHDKPELYYLSLLAYTHREAGPRWSEALVLVLAYIGGIGAILKAMMSGKSASRAEWVDRLLPLGLFTYTVLSTAIFALIPYKTPWNLLPFLQPMILLAGYGAACLISWIGVIPLRRGREIVMASAGVLIFLLSLMPLRQSWLGTTVYAADTRNPYVYAHTSSALFRALDTIDSLAALHPDDKAMRIDILKPDMDYWPLPWYLRDYTAIGYWRKLPPQFEAPVVITEPLLGKMVNDTLGEGRYVSQFVGLRPGTNLLLFVERSLWEKLLASRGGDSSGK